MRRREYCVAVVECWFRPCHITVAIKVASGPKLKLSKKLWLWASDHYVSGEQGHLTSCQGAEPWQTHVGCTLKESTDFYLFQEDRSRIVFQSIKTFWCLSVSLISQDEPPLEVEVFAHVPLSERLLYVFPLLCLIPPLYYTQWRIIISPEIMTSCYFWFCSHLENPGLAKSILVIILLLLMTGFEQSCILPWNISEIKI